MRKMGAYSRWRHGGRWRANGELARILGCPFLISCPDPTTALLCDAKPSFKLTAADAVSSVTEPCRSVRDAQLERHEHSRSGVTHRNVETLIGRLATDPALRRRFAHDARAVLKELREQGYELTPVEREALASTDADAIASFAD